MVQLLSFMKNNNWQLQPHDDDTDANFFSFFSDAYLNVTSDFEEPLLKLVNLSSVSLMSWKKIATQVVLLWNWH